jgi:hypothetical protein
MGCPRSRLLCSEETFTIAAVVSATPSIIPTVSVVVPSTHAHAIEGRYHALIARSGTTSRTEAGASQPNDDENIKQIEANGRNNEQVHGGDVRRVVTQEGAPSLGRRSTSLHHVLRDAGLTDLEAELEQLAMNARRPPQGFSALIRRINARSSAPIFGRPPGERVDSVTQSIRMRFYGIGP